MTGSLAGSLILILNLGLTFFMLKFSLQQDPPMVRIHRPSNLRHGFTSFEYSQLSPLSMVEFDRASSCFVSPTH